jgi:subtilisin family serine protease
VIAVSPDDARDPAATVGAPGHDVPTTLPGARWGFVDGSSFAAAHVSAMVALLRQLVPSLGPEQTRALLLIAAGADSGARPASQRIDACAVISRAAGACSCACKAGARDKIVSRR